MPVLFPDRPARNEKERKRAIGSRKEKVGDLIRTLVLCELFWSEAAYLLHRCLKKFA